MKLTVLLIAMFFSGSLMAQSDTSIINTSWKGTVNVPSPTEVVFSFLKDSIKILIGDEVLEVMTYEKKADLFYIHKVYGASPCDKEPLLVWKVTIKGEELIINTISDDCPHRSTNLGEDTFFTRYKTKLIN